MRSVLLDPTQLGRISLSRNHADDNCCSCHVFSNSPVELELFILDLLQERIDRH